MKSKLAMFKDSITSWYFGNTVEPYANILGMRNWMGAIRSSGVAKNSLHDRFMKIGYVFLGRLFREEDILAVKQEYLEAINSDEHSESVFQNEDVRKAYNYGNFDGDVANYRRDIIDCDRSLPSLRRLWSDGNFKNVLTQILRCPFEPSPPATLAWRIQHVPAEISEKFEINTNRFHFDDQYVDRIKIFIYLSDVTEDDGPFRTFQRTTQEVFC